MSRMAVVPMLLPMLPIAGPAAAQPITAEQAMENYRRMFPAVAETLCPRSPDPETIVVCGERERADPNRIPLPDLVEPGARTRLIPGEPPTPVGALNAEASGRGGGIDVIRAIGLIRRGLTRILDPDS